MTRNTEFTARTIDAEQNLIGSVHVTRDISERKQAEEKLRLSEAKYRTLFDCAYDAVLVFSTDDETILEANRQASLIYGFSHDELVGKSLDLFQPEDRRGRERTMEIVHQTTVRGLEIVHRRKDGTPVFIEVRARLVEYGGREVVLSVNRDISDRKRAEEEQIRLRDQLQHAHTMKAVGQLAAGIAHEFNNLLVGILGNAELLLDSLTNETSALFRQPLEDIETCGHRAASLIQQLLGFAKKRTSDVRPLDLNATVVEADRLLQRLLGEHISIQTVLAPDLCTIRADRSEMQRAIMNLAINARDAMPNGGALTIRTGNVTLDEAYARENAGARTGPHAELVIADTGCGMSDEIAKRIFEPFFTTKPEGKGTGLGLATVMDDVMRLGGHITVDSRVGTGTVVRIFVPEAEAVAEEGEVDTCRSAARRLTGNETILVCDDEKLVLDSISSRLDAAGYTVIRARSGREALERASSHAAPISMLLTDVVMPEMNGPQLARALTRQHPDVSVLYMSGYPADALLAGEPEGGDMEFLQKPPTGDALLTRVRELLDQRRDSAGQLS